jgi:hypothetical protein
MQASYRFCDESFLPLLKESNKQKKKQMYTSTFIEKHISYVIIQIYNFSKYKNYDLTDIACFDLSK